MKKEFRCFILFILLVLFYNCSKPLSDEYNKFIGIWQSDKYFLNINKRGIASYTYFKNGLSINTSGPISYIGYNKITYKVSLFRKTLLIQKPPYKENERWKMVLENNEFVRISDQGWDSHEILKRRFNSILKKKKK